MTYHYTTPDVHRSNGQVKRYMRTIMNLIRVETSIKSDWSKSIWKIQHLEDTTCFKFDYTKAHSNFTFKSPDWNRRLNTSDPEFTEEP